MKENLNLNQIEMENRPLGFFQKLIGIFLSPLEVIENISYHPKMLMPLIYSSIVMIAAYFIRFPLMKITEEKLSAISIEKYGADLFQASQSTDSIYLVSGFLSPLTLLLTWIVGGLFLWLLVKMFGGTSGVKEILSLYAHIMMISMTGALLAAPIGLLLDTDITIFSLAVFMPNGDITSFMYNLFMLIEVFSIWSMLVAGLGICILNQFSKVKAGTIVGLHFFIGNAFTAFMATLPYMMINLLQNM